jgi:LL-diaminopimelate aminotransferase
LDFFERVVKFAKENQIMICHDAAYTEIYYDKKPPSFLEASGAKDVGIEFHSLSKTYNMTGWRVGFAVGNAQMIQGLAKVKANLDSGIFQAIQLAGIKALSLGEKEREGLLKTYQERRDILVQGLKEAGWKVKTPTASFYIWASLPENYDSKGLALKLLEEIGIVATPGIGFGPSGEGYIRFSLTMPVDRIQEAVLRLKKSTVHSQ